MDWPNVKFSVYFSVLFIHIIVLQGSSFTRQSYWLVRQTAVFASTPHHSPVPRVHARLHSSKFQNIQDSSLHSSYRR